MFCFLNIVIGMIESIPISFYSDFVIEEKHGFNKKTVKLFFTDLVKQTLLTIAIGGPLLVAMIWIVKWGGKTFYIYLWAFSTLVTIVFMFVYPNYIAPLFNKYETLKDQELRQKIDALCLRLQFPLKELYQVDGSKRSNHSNAYFYGFWKNKRIVLYDTLLENPHEEILAILGHELGHWKLGHTMKGMALGLVQMFVIFYLYGLVMYNDSLFNSFGFGDTRAVIIGLFLFSMIFSPVETFLGVLITLLTRMHEFQADRFSFDLGYGDQLQSALVNIHKQNLGVLTPDKWYAWFHYTHPPLVERLRAIKSSTDPTYPRLISPNNEQTN